MTSGLVALPKRWDEDVASSVTPCSVQNVHTFDLCKNLVLKGSLVAFLRFMPRRDW